MASDDRNPLYEEYEAEFNTLREDMDALGIGASFKPLISYENWSRYRPSKRTFIVGHARRDSKLATDRAKKAAAAAHAAAHAAARGSHSLPEKFEQNYGNNAFRNHLIDVDKMIVSYSSECILNG